MEDSPQLCISEFGEFEKDLEDQEQEGCEEDDGDRNYNISQGETNMELDPEFYKHSNQCAHYIDAALCGFVPQHPLTVICPPLCHSVTALLSQTNKEHWATIMLANIVTRFSLRTVHQQATA